MSLSKNQRITIGIAVIIAVVAILNLFFGSGVLLNKNVNIQQPDLSTLVVAEGIAIILLTVIVALQLIFSLMQPAGRRGNRTDTPNTSG